MFRRTMGIVGTFDVNTRAFLANLFIAAIRIRRTRRHELRNTVLIDTKFIRKTDIVTASAVLNV